MALLTRNTLKNFFKSGSAPTEVNFSDLIDSTMNKVDDGIGKNQEDGMIFALQGKSRRVVSFFEHIKNRNPLFSISFSDDKLTKGISFDDSEKESCLFLKDGTQVGIGTKRPQHTLDVKGFVGMKGRVGTYLQGTIPADREWHNIIENLDDCQAFEVMAKAAGRKGRGKYSMVHAIAISTFGKSHSRIRKTTAHYSAFWHRIQLRWKSDSQHNYHLQMRTRSHYGLDENELPYMIQYNITNLWPHNIQQETEEGSNFKPVEKLTADSFDL
ncbi:MAG: hypothetical protein ACI94Y_000982 [Maribacter sp.]|jgi:hypothetical protein